MALSETEIGLCIGGGCVAALMTGSGLRRLGLPGGPVVVIAAVLGVGTFMEINAVVNRKTFHVFSLAAPFVLLLMALVPAGLGVAFARRVPLRGEVQSLVLWSVAALSVSLILPASMSPTLGGAPICAIGGWIWWMIGGFVIVLSTLVAFKHPAVAILIAMACAIGAAFGWSWDPLLKSKYVQGTVFGWPVVIVTALILVGALGRWAGMGTAARTARVPRGPRAKRVHLIWVAFILTCGPGEAGESGPLRFDPPEITIAPNIEDTQGSYVCHVTNSSDHSVCVSIQSVTAGCSCITHALAHSALAPGQQTDVTLGMKTGHALFSL